MAKMDTLTEMPAFAPAESWSDVGRSARGMSVGKGELGIGDPLDRDGVADDRVSLVVDGTGVVIAPVVFGGT